MKRYTHLYFALVIFSFLFASIGGAQIIRLKEAKEFKSINSNLVLFAHLRLYSKEKGKKKKNIKEITLNGKKLKDFLGTIQFDFPKESGVPAAIITGELILSIKSTTLRLVTDRTFTIYNNILLYDNKTQTVHYLINKPIRYSDY